VAVDLVVETDLSLELPQELTLMPADIGDLVSELASYHARYAPLFRRREQRESAEIYLKGLLVADVSRKNVEAMVLRLMGAGLEAENRVRALQQFIGEGRWDDEAILAEHWRLVDDSLGEEDGVLIIDGSDIPKQGAHSAGVARQWCGATGKKDNCQAGVFLGYASRKGYTLLDRRLYLPERWFGEEYRDRWRKAKIPEETPFRTKHELAAEMVEALMKDRRLRARWMVCDEGYGDDPQTLDRIAAKGLHYLAEVSKSTQVWPIMEPDGKTLRAQPKTYLKPPHPSGRGQPPCRKRLDPESPPKMRVDDLAEGLSVDQWHRYRILEGSKGPLVADFAAVCGFRPIACIGSAARRALIPLQCEQPFHFIAGSDSGPL
jgi:hypothetical protein